MSHGFLWSLGLLANGGAVVTLGVVMGELTRSIWMICSSSLPRWAISCSIPIL